jgi:hypothetical protein
MIIPIRLPADCEIMVGVGYVILGVSPHDVCDVGRVAAQLRHHLNTQTNSLVVILAQVIKHELYSYAKFKKKILLPLTGFVHVCD